MRSKFKNTTALIAAVSLAMPTIAPAQDAAAICDVDDIGVTAELANTLELNLNDDQRAALDGASVESDVTVAMVNDTPTLCLSVAELEAMGASPEQIAMAMDADQMTAEVTAETEAEIEVESEAQDGVAMLEGEAEATEETAQDGVAMLEENAETVEAEAEETEAEVAAGAEAEAEAEVEVEQDTVETDMEVEAEAETEQETAETDMEAETEAEVTAEAEATAEADAQDSVAQALTDAGNAVAAAGDEAEERMNELRAAIEEQSAQEADATVQAEIAEQAAPMESAAADESAEAAEVEEEVITEADARSSSEEFDGKMETTAGATVSADGGSDNLSNFEKALVLGLGAVVVGQALRGGSDAQVVSKSNDRVVLLEDGRYRVIRDDNELIERPGSTVRRERFEDGSTRTVVTREDGVRIMTIRDPELRVLRRVRIDVDGTQTVLIDDTTEYEPVDVSTLPEPMEYVELEADADVATLRKALDRANRPNRRFALYQVRNIERVRKLAPAIQLDAINFRTGSAVIEAQEAEELTELGNLIAEYIAQNPAEVFLIEGHTDAVGDAAYNLALSDRRAESVALALTEYFDVPPENLVVQGYGESDLKVRTLEAERANRRAAVRRITPLITASN